LKINKKDFSKINSEIKNKTMSAHSHIEKNNLISKIRKDTDVNVYKCYQCGKCSAGCPVALEEMEYPPSVIMRMLQTEDKENEELLKKSYAIWVCLTCEMCYTRCPMEIDIPKVMDNIRQAAIAENKVHPKAKTIVAGHKAFLKTIENNGRLHEFGFVMNYKFSTFEFMKDVTVAPGMMQRGKLHLFAEKIKDIKHLSKIFEKSQKNTEN